MGDRGLMDFPWGLEGFLGFKGGHFVGVWSGDFPFQGVLQGSAALEVACLRNTRTTAASRQVDVQGQALKARHAT